MPVTRLLLLAALGAMPAVASGQAAEAGPMNTAWFDAPCLGDSVDTWGWTRYDLHGIRFRVFPGVRQIKFPSMDELQFRYGQATMRVRLRRDASQFFADYYKPEYARKHCWGEFSGGLAEAISMRIGSSYGFAARWPDADRGEWLAVVIQGRTLEEVTLLRRSLFTIVFPGAK